MKVKTDIKKINLEDAIAAGTFRNDLYHRLKVVTVRLPTLVERSQDRARPDNDPMSDDLDSIG